jgi:hypothetical protein
MTPVAYGCPASPDHRVLGRRRRTLRLPGQRGVSGHGRLHPVGAGAAHRPPGPTGARARRGHRHRVRSPDRRRTRPRGGRDRSVHSHDRSIRGTPLHRPHHIRGRRRRPPPRSPGQASTPSSAAACCGPCAKPRRPSATDTSCYARAAAPSPSTGWPPHRRTLRHRTPTPRTRTCTSPSGTTRPRRRPRCRPCAWPTTRSSCRPRPRPVPRRPHDRPGDGPRMGDLPRLQPSLRTHRLHALRTRRATKRGVTHVPHRFRPPPIIPSRQPPCPCVPGPVPSPPRVGCPHRQAPAGVSLEEPHRDTVPRLRVEGCRCSSIPVRPAR